MTNVAYTRTAIALHWLTLLLVACGFALAVYMVDLPESPQQFKYFAWHKWLGVTVFVLVVARLAWRLTHPAPAQSALMPVWQQRAATVMHAVLYALLLVIPLTGWLYSSAAGESTVYLGMVQLPDFLVKDKALAEQLKLVHVTLDYTLLTLIVIHAAAALKHHVADRDDVLRRMLPCVKPAGE